MTEPTPATRDADALVQLALTAAVEACAQYGQYDRDYADAIAYDTAVAILEAILAVDTANAADLLRERLDIEAGDAT